MPIGTSKALVTWNFKSSEWTRWRFCVQVQKIHVSQLPGQPWLLLWSFEIPNFGTKTWMRKNPGFRFMPGFQDNRITLHFVGFHIPKNDTHTRKAIDVTISKTNWWPTSPTHHFSRFTLWLIRIFKNRKKHGLFEIWTFECLRIKFSKNHKKPTVYKLNRSKSESKRFTGYFFSFAPSCFFFFCFISCQNLPPTNFPWCPVTNALLEILIDLFQQVGSAILCLVSESTAQFSSCTWFTWLSTTCETSFLSNWKGMNKYCWWLKSCTSWGW